ncbi:hypothetical protein BDV39DRAFT_210550 [Aspergillus sergii]|uniref:Uncharacterized protein n=1 Tax=Aspergillus sergii TaxID=1034303 RepID=A0A5N6WL94_9EURO|nr:hypothetical protein BDV39DRAFT_210550 [Aspergillus sergii]
MSQDAPSPMANSQTIDFATLASRDTEEVCRIVESATDDRFFYLNLRGWKDVQEAQRRESKDGDSLMPMDISLSDSNLESSEAREMGMSLFTSHVVRSSRAIHCQKWSDKASKHSMIYTSAHIL